MHNAGSIIEDRFRLEQHLGDGGFGSVWRATDLKRGGPVALKFLRSTDAEDLTRFAREARALRALEHPNCVALVSFHRDASTPFLVTEFVDGESLQTWAKRRPTVPEIVEATRAIASALAAAHSRGIVHRDLKPDNVLVRREPTGLVVKVLDFGLASIIGDVQGDVTQTGEVIGTPGFMSPEQLRGLKGVGPPTDLYCLGSILYELLEGHPPFSGRTALEVSFQHLTQPVPPMNPALPENLRALTLALLEKTPDLRPASAADVVRLLQAEPPAHARTWARPAIAAALLLIAIGLLLLADEPEAPVASVRNTERSTADLLIKTTRPLAVPGGPGPSAPPAEPDAGAPARTAGCGVPWSLGLQTVDLGHGVTATAYLPRTYDSERPHKALVLLHKYKRDGRSILEETDLFDQADKHGYVLLAPNDLSVPRRRVWEHEDALARVWNALRRSEDLLCLEPAGFAVLGHIHGGWAAHYYACKAETVTAVISDGFRFRPDQRCPLARPTPYLLIDAGKATPRDGFRDADVRLLPWESRDLVSLDEHVAQLRDANRCGSKRNTVRTEPAGTCYEYEDCDAPLQVCEFDIIAHWVSPERSSATFPRKEVIFDFLAAQRGK